MHPRSLGHYQRIGLAAFIAAAAFLLVVLSIHWYRTAIGFPRSGTVTLTRAGQMVRQKSHLRVLSGPEDLVVQLFNARSRTLYATIYAGANLTVDADVPSGVYRVRLVRGARWEGPSTLFGETNAFVELSDPLTFTARRGQLVGLVEPGEGNLPGRRVRPKDPLAYR